MIRRLKRTFKTFCDLLGLVEKFGDLYLPIANSNSQCCLWSKTFPNPVFPICLTVEDPKFPVRSVPDALEKAAEQVLHDLQGEGGDTKVDLMEACGLFGGLVESIWSIHGSMYMQCFSCYGPMFLCASNSMMIFFEHMFCIGVVQQRKRKVSIPKRLSLHKFCFGVAL